MKVTNNRLEGEPDHMLYNGQENFPANHSFEKCSLCICNRNPKVINVFFCCMQPPHCESGVRVYEASMKGVIKIRIANHKAGQYRRDQERW